jgi:Domain of unknown function(DUF2779)
MRISKTKFVAGIQCLKRLYLQVHSPDLATVSDEAADAIIEQGREVGLVAQKAFPGGVAVKVSATDLDEAIRATTQLVSNPEIPAILEATFEYAGVLVRTDVLKRTGRLGYDLIEVKASTALKPHYAYDVGIQSYVVSGAGLVVDHACVMHLNRDYVFDGKEYDVSRLFVVTNLKPGDIASEGEIARRLDDQFRILSQPAPPDVKPGRQCEDPVLCEFYKHCNEEPPSDHVSLLPRIPAQKVEELLTLGITSIKDIPDNFDLSERQRRAVDCAKTGKPFISDELAGELSVLRFPICFMDFETVFPALPRFAGMAPYDHIPFQWSVFRQERPGEELQDFEYLAEDDSDPRTPFAESLRRAVKDAGSIVVYNQSFESSRLDELARWLPEHASQIEEIKEKLCDLLLFVRRNVYHSDFAGSFSLKSILPALVPHMSYANLEIADGIGAGLAWMRLLDFRTSLEEKARIKEALSDYCRQDTLALAMLLEVLRQHGS